MHYLYIAITEDRKICKIGWTACPLTRFTGLRSEARKKFNSPTSVLALWPAPNQKWSDEIEVQEKFAVHAMKPESEWFHAHSDIIEFAEAMGRIESLLPAFVPRKSKRKTPPKAGPGRPRKNTEEQK